MINVALMIAVALLLVVALVTARRSARRQAQLERDNEAMRRDLDHHRTVARSILEELQKS
jgi:type II secretory pathway pseudopilin PulG